jgi:hypothetical protein
MSIETEPTAGELIANEASASVRKKTAAAKPKGAPASKSRKAAGRPPQSSRAKLGWREVDLPVLWQRRSRTVVQQEAGRALPRLL